MPTLAILGAQPGIGKSALLATIAWHQAKVGRRVLFFSLEDERRWLFDRLLARESGVPQWQLRSHGSFSPEAEEWFQDGLGKVHHWGKNVIVCDKPGMSADEVYAVTMQAASLQALDLVIVDHIGEIKSLEKRDRYDLEVKDTISVLRRISHKLQIPTIVCSHTKRPDIDGHEAGQSALANSSYLERLARLVLLLQRGEGPGTICLKIAKNTHGKMGQKLLIKLLTDSATIDSDWGEEVSDG